MYDDNISALDQTTELDAHADPSAGLSTTGTCIVAHFTYSLAMKY